MYNTADFYFRHMMLGNKNTCLLNIDEISIPSFNIETKRNVQEVRQVDKYVRPTSIVLKFYFITISIEIYVFLKLQITGLSFLTKNRNVSKFKTLHISFL